MSQLELLKGESTEHSSGGGGLKTASQQVKQTTTSIIESARQVEDIPQMAPVSSTQSLLLFLGYQKNTNQEYEDFKDKNVLDIGGGFSGIAGELHTAAKEIIVVDPIFRNPKIAPILEKNLEDQKKLIWLREEYLKRNPEKKHISTDICEAKLVLQEASWWQQYSFQDYPRVKRNPSYGEKLNGIGDETQDVVFLNYVLSKETVQPIEVLQEVNRVLHKKGVCIISDYALAAEVKEYIGNNFRIEGEDDSDGIVLKCFKK